MASAPGACELCPRRCGVDRRAGARGFCGAGASTEVYRYGAHDGEEPPVSGVRGSGTVFFSRCTLRCLYCQNHPWSQEGQGEAYDTARLARAFEELARAGCHNWNLVSPTPWLPMIRAAVEAAKARGWSLPLVYNTSGFERAEVLEEYADLADVYLTDLRYATEASAREGSGRADYAAAARAALEWMWARRPGLRLAADGTAAEGTICRLLILPGRAAEAVANLEWLAHTVGTGIAVSVMAQYLPLHRAAAAGGDWGRRVTRAEYDAVCAAVERLNFEEGWVQDFEGDAPGHLVGCRMEAGGPATGNGRAQRDARRGS